MTLDKKKLFFYILIIASNIFFVGFTVILVGFLVEIVPCSSSFKVSPILLLQVLAVRQVLQVLQVHSVDAQGCLVDDDCQALSHYCLLMMLVGILYGREASQS